MDMTKVLNIEEKQRKASLSEWHAGKGTSPDKRVEAESVRVRPAGPDPSGDPAGVCRKPFPQEPFTTHDLYEQKNLFLRIVAHELKNPLGNLQNMLSLAADERGLTEQTREWLRLSLQSIDGMFGLIDDLLDVNALESQDYPLQIEAVSVLLALESTTAAMIDRALLKQIVIDCAEVPSSWSVWADCRALEQALGNLLSNAVKFSPAGRTVTVTAVACGSQIRFEIRDEGPGIPLAEQGRLFQQFGRLSTRPTAGEKSTGLGLYIVKALVTAMNGQVGFESCPGEGALFWFTLPRVDQHSAGWRRPPA